MQSVRLRLLVLALAPLVLLMPLLLGLGMARFTADYDKVLIAKVNSDLRIAEQYLARLMIGTGDDLTAIAESAELARVLSDEQARLPSTLQVWRDALSLDFLYYLPAKAAADPRSRWPVIQTALAGEASSAIDLLDASALAQLTRRASGDLAARARIPLIDTEAAVPTDREVEDRGMIIHAASPVSHQGHKGVLVGGILLNRNLDFIDTINALVYLNATTGGDLQGTATLFLDDVRVSTNVRLFEDVRALGTRVSAAVREAVLGQGQTWLARAFVVNDWYISGYLPLTDSFGDRVGMLYVGFLEAPFNREKMAAVLWMFAAFAAVLLISVPVFFWMAKGIFAPLERMTQTMQRVGRGDLSARNKAGKARGEIGQVAAHLDDLLDQVQDRDARLRAWAEELNDRVDQRTSELRDANEKLEETWRQLVMSEKLASIGEITAGVAHEINNPVAVIQGNVDVLREALGPQASPVQTELTLIDRQVTRIQAIVGKLLTFARPSEFSDSADRTTVAPVVDDCLLLVDHLLARGDFDVVTEMDRSLSVRIDPGELQQVVINLVVNALQAMDGAGRLELTVAARHRDDVAGVVLSVADTGPGIAEDKIGTVFDPFFTTKLGEGTGLGLSISQSLIQRAGGLITARNRRSTGVVFDVWLPAVSFP